MSSVYIYTLLPVWATCDRLCLICKGPGAASPIGCTVSRRPLFIWLISRFFYWVDKGGLWQPGVSTFEFKIYTVHQGQQIEDGTEYISCTVHGVYYWYLVLSHAKSDHVNDVCKSTRHCAKLLLGVTLGLATPGMKPSLVWTGVSLAWKKNHNRTSIQGHPLILVTRCSH